MKKRLSVLRKSICRICCLMFFGICFGLPAQADMIWTPEDSFFQKHESECVYVNRQFTAHGPDGVVIYYKSPELPVEVGRWENGFSTYISFTYEDENGILWGLCEQGGTCGWMPMEYMDAVYDTLSFEEEYGDRIERKEGALDEKYLGKDIYIWSYPGAATGSPMTVDKSYEYMPAYTLLFVDETGKSWGKTGYYLGRRNFWICLDQPEADYGQLYPEGGPERGKSVTDSGENTEAGAERIVPKMNGGTIRLAVCMVAAVVLITAALLVLLKRKDTGKR